MLSLDITLCCLYGPNDDQPIFYNHVRDIIDRLDFFLISSELLNLIDYADILPGYRTDHSMVIIGLNKCNSITRGRGSWKLNNDLLKEEEYVKRIQ